MPNTAPISFADGLLQSYLAVNELGHRKTVEPALLVCWPYGRNNRYQDLLYSTSLDYGIGICPITSLEQLEEISWPGRVLFHAHWFASLYLGKESEEEAFATTDAAFRRIEEFKRRTDSRLLWTAHNLFPHDTPFPRASLDLRQRIFRRFDAVHVLSESHLQTLIETYGLGPKHAFAVPHMLYDGVYPNFIPPRKARQTLGISLDAYVFCFFGSIQAYKGLDTLVRSFRALVESGRREAILLIAGNPAGHGSEKFLQEISEDANIILDIRRIPDDQVQIFLNAGDIMVFPYVDTLNSGAASLAATFGKRMIVPRTMAFLDFEPFGAAFYDADDEGSLLRRMIVEYDGRMSRVERPLYPTARSREIVSQLFFDSVVEAGLF